RATADDLPAYVVFHNATLAEIAGRRPRDLSELGTVPGVGPTKLERYGDEVLAVLGAAAQCTRSGARRPARGSGCRQRKRFSTARSTWARRDGFARAE